MPDYFRLCQQILSWEMACIRRHNKPSFLTPRSDDRPRSAVLFAGTCPSRTAVILTFILQIFAASVFATGHGFQGAALESAIVAQE